MRILIAYYSRTGNTKTVGDLIAQKLGADVEEIKDTVDRSGVKGYIRAGYEAVRKKLPALQPVTKDPAEYDLVILGTPNWGRLMASPVRSYVTGQKDKFRQVAFFCTEGGTGEEQLFADMEQVIGKKPLRTLMVREREVKSSEHTAKVETFVAGLR